MNWIAPNERRAAAGRQRGFSLLEMLLVASMMTIIVYGLYSMFDQTQRALRNSGAQVDVQEAGRAALEIITREIEQMACGYGSNAPNVEAILTFPNPKINQTWLDTVIQSLPSGVKRINYLQQLFFLKNESGRINAGGFFVADPNDATITTNLGTLYRFIPTYDPTPHVDTVWLTAVQNQFDRRTNAVFPLIEGVVHLAWRTVSPLGRVMIYDGDTNQYYAGYQVWQPPTQPMPLCPNVLLLDKKVPLSRATLDQTTLDLRLTDFSYLSNALPAYVELELGLLEPQAWEKVKAMPNSTVRRKYLDTHAGQVHIFRKRIPIRTATP
jgi:prepilin-type N-terminal cleavage/methylation domain-containing protein